MKINYKRKFYKEILSENDFLNFLKETDKDIKFLTKEAKIWFIENKYQTFNKSFFHIGLYKEIYKNNPRSKMTKEYWKIRGYTNKECKELSIKSNKLICEKSIEEMKLLSAEDRKLRYDSGSKKFFKNKFGDDWENLYKINGTNRTKKLKSTKKYWEDLGINENEIDNRISRYQKEIAKVYWSSENSKNRLIPTQKKYWVNKGLSEIEAKEKVSEIQSRFSLESCIIKYGEIDGTKIWKKRNSDWYKTLEDTFTKKYGKVN